MDYEANFNQPSLKRSINIDLFKKNLNRWPNPFLKWEILNYMYIENTMMIFKFFFFRTIFSEGLIKFKVVGWTMWPMGGLLFTIWFRDNIKIVCSIAGSFISQHCQLLTRNAFKNCARLPFEIYCMCIILIILAYEYFTVYRLRNLVLRHNVLNDRHCPCPIIINVE